MNINQQSGYGGSVPERNITGQTQGFFSVSSHSSQMPMMDKNQPVFSSMANNMSNNNTNQDSFDQSDSLTNSNSKEELSRRFLDMRSSYSEKVGFKGNYTKYARRPTFPYGSQPQQHQQPYSLLQSKSPNFMGSQRKTYIPNESTLAMGSFYKSSSSVDVSHAENANDDGDDDMLDNFVYREYGSATSLEVHAPNHAIIENKSKKGKHARTNSESVKGKLTHAPYSVDNQHIKAESGKSSRIDKPPISKDKPNIVPRQVKGREQKERPKTQIIENKSGFLHKLFSSKPDVAATDVEDSLRAKAFVHFDCQSLFFRRNGFTGVNSSTASGVDSKQSRNATGASAVKTESDLGDGIMNELVESCANFRNEIGTIVYKDMPDWTVGMPRDVADNSSFSNYYNGYEMLSTYHQLGSAVSILELPADLLNPERISLGFISLNNFVVEFIDQGACYYRKYFAGREHQNFLGVDGRLGPVAISLRREKVFASYRETPTRKRDDLITTCFQYRVIVRTKQLAALRGCILEDVIPSSSRLSSNKGLPPKDILDYVIPDLDIHCLRHAMSGKKLEDELSKLDEQKLNFSYKFGVLYCQPGQTTEEEMYNNEHGSDNFNDFLKLLGNKVRLRNFDKYKGGLDTTTDSTGTHSIYWQQNEFEIMYHVSTLLPYSAINKQQILRKCHIGNDIVTIIFQEPGCQPFSAKSFVSNFQHVFIIVRLVSTGSNQPKYSVAVMRAKNVPKFGPPILENQLFDAAQLAHFLPVKAMNAENAVHLSEKFIAMTIKTREAMLKDLALNSTTSSVVDNSSRMVKFSFGSGRKKTKQDARSAPDYFAPGGLAWQMLVENVAESSYVSCQIVISHHLIVIISQVTNQVILVVSCQSVIGWTMKDNCVRVYFNHGEYFTIKEARSDLSVDEIVEVVNRLSKVTNGTMTQEITITKNSSGQLGFHINSNRVVSDVESGSRAWLAGLRAGSRLLEICESALVTLTDNKLLDLLHQQAVVTVVVVPPHSDGKSRSGDGILHSVCTNAHPVSKLVPSESAPEALSVLQDFTDGEISQSKSIEFKQSVQNVDKSWQVMKSNLVGVHPNLDLHNVDDRQPMRMVDYQKSTTSSWQQTLRDTNDMPVAFKESNNELQDKRWHLNEDSDASKLQNFGWSVSDSQSDKQNILGAKRLQSVMDPPSQQVSYPKQADINSNMASQINYSDFRSHQQIPTSANNQISNSQYRSANVLVPSKQGTNSDETRLFSEGSSQLTRKDILSTDPQYRPTNLLQITKQGPNSDKLSSNHSSWDHLVDHRASSTAGSSDSARFIDNRAPSAASSSDSARSDSAYQIKTHQHLVNSKSLDYPSDHYLSTKQASSLSSKATETQFHQQVALARQGGTDLSHEQLLSEQSIARRNELRSFDDRGPVMLKSTDELRWVTVGESKWPSQSKDTKQVPDPDNRQMTAGSDGSQMVTAAVKPEMRSTVDNLPVNLPSSNAQEKLASKGQNKDTMAIEGGPNQQLRSDNISLKTGYTATQVHPKQVGSSPVQKPTVSNVSIKNTTPSAQNRTVEQNQKAKGSIQQKIDSGLRSNFTHNRPPAKSAVSQLMTVPQKQQTMSKTLDPKKPSDQGSLLKIVQKKSGEDKGKGGISRVRSDESLCGARTEGILKPDSWYPPFTRDKSIEFNRLPQTQTSLMEIKAVEISLPSTVPLISGDNFEWPQLVDVANSISDGANKHPIANHPVTNKLSADEKVSLSKPEKPSTSSAAAQLELMKERVSPRHLEEINQLRLLLAKEQSEKQQLQSEVKQLKYQVTDLQKENTSLRGENSRLKGALSDWNVANAGYV